MPTQKKRQDSDNAAAAAANGDDSGRSSSDSAGVPAEEHQTRPKARRRPARRSKSVKPAKKKAEPKADDQPAPPQDRAGHTEPEDGSGADPKQAEIPENLPWFSWKPRPDATVEIRWALLEQEDMPEREDTPEQEGMPEQEGASFATKVLLLQDATPGPRERRPGAAGSTGERSHLEIVAAVVSSANPEVPFSLRRDNEPRPFLFGSLDWSQGQQGAELSVSQLKYPGGFVDFQRLFPESKPGGAASS